MKRPKNRGSVYAVVRTEVVGVEDRHDGRKELYGNPHVVGVFLTIERADEVVAAYEQDAEDNNVDNLFFEVQASNYYDE